MRAAVTAAAALRGMAPKGKPLSAFRTPRGAALRAVHARGGHRQKTGVCPAYYGIMGCRNRTQRARRKFCRAAGLACTLGAAAKRALRAAACEARTERRHCHERDTAAPAARAAPAGKAQPGLGRPSAHGGALCCPLCCCAWRQCPPCRCFWRGGWKTAFACPCLPWLAGRAAVPFVRCECAVRAPALGLPACGQALPVRRATIWLTPVYAAQGRPAAARWRAAPKAAMRQRMRRCPCRCLPAPCGRRGLAYGGIWPLRAC